MKRTNEKLFNSGSIEEINYNPMSPHAHKQDPKRIPLRMSSVNLNELVNENSDDRGT